MDLDAGIGIDVNVDLDADANADANADADADVDAIVEAVGGLSDSISMLITELERSLSDIQLPYLLEDA